MEYVDNAVTRHFYHKVSPEQLMDVLRAVAFLEAKSLQLKDEEKHKLESNPIKTIYSRFITPNVVSKAFRDMCTVYKELKPSAEELLKLVEEMLDLDLPSTLNKELGMKDVFVHGDLWSANLLWTRTTDGVLFSKYIDHQQAHFGCPAEDLCRLFISTLSGADRRANWERLLEEFHGYIVQYSEGELPFTLEQLKEAYRRMFPLAGVLLSEIYDLAVKVALRKLSDEEKVVAQAVVAEKAFALFEDMVYYAKRNREVRRSTNSTTCRFSK
ncbi:hypothetical protein OESDEN_02344 [Oesophagostomum dentatum]|uniref:CHK kinase-like domain-containing protein n=1 Tax=Oesophagostomum dentatum TaxID=61180 RepID=A0A0B1TKC8_OESDE|nr:hypothetical protein OESDEN_02344 [Oesophagostomum dentatum]